MAADIFFNSDDTVSMTGAYTRIFGGLGAGVLLVQFGTDYHTEDAFRMDKICSYTTDSFSLYFGNTIDCEVFSYNIPLSLKTLNKLKGLNIYPNPAQSILHVDLEKERKDLNIKIVNLLGCVVINGISIRQLQNTIDISTLNSGMYVMIIESDGERYYHKFVKQ